MGTGKRDSEEEEEEEGEGEEDEEEEKEEEGVGAGDLIPGLSHFSVACLIVQRRKALAPASPAPGVQPGGLVPLGGRPLGRGGDRAGGAVSSALVGKLNPTWAPTPQPGEGQPDLRAVIGLYPLAMPRDGRPEPPVASPGSSSSCC